MNKTTSCVTKKLNRVYEERFKMLNEAEVRKLHLPKLNKELANLLKISSKKKEEDEKKKKTTIVKNPFNSNLNFIPIIKIKIFLFFNYYVI